MASSWPLERQAITDSALEPDPQDPLPSYDTAINGHVSREALPDLKASQWSHVERLDRAQSTPSSSSSSSTWNNNTACFKTYAVFHATSFRTFTFWAFKSLSKFTTLHAATTVDDPCVYHVESSVFTPKIPDIQLYAGDGERGKILASAKFYNWKSDITLAVGDGSERNCHGSSSLPGFLPPVYEELIKVSVVAHSEYTFSTDFTQDDARRRYTWKRSATGKDLCWDYVCVENDTGEIVARFENAGLKWKKSGDFRFVKSEGEKWEVLVLVAFLSIREKENRFAAYSNGVCV